MAGRLNPKVVALSLVAVSAILSLLCALFIAVAPAATLKFFGSIFHGMDVAQTAAPITVSSVVTGLVAISVAAFVAGWLFTVIYNRLSKK